MYYRSLNTLFCDWLQEKRLSGVSNQSHDSQASNSTASATSHDERQGLNNQGGSLLDGHAHEQDEEELDEMEVEYIEVSILVPMKPQEAFDSTDFVGEWEKNEGKST